MRLKDVVLSLMVDLIVYFLVTEFVPSTTTYGVIIALAAPTVFWIAVNITSRKHGED